MERVGGSSGPFLFRFIWKTLVKICVCERRARVFLYAMTMVKMCRGV